MSQGRQGTTGRRGAELRQSRELHNAIESIHHAVDAVQAQLVDIRRAIVQVETIVREGQ